MAFSSLRVACLLAAIGAAPAPVEADDWNWVELISADGFEAWKPPIGAWAVVGEVRTSPENPRRLSAEPGRGIIYNGPEGKTTNLVTKAEFGDVELRAEFFIPKGSNSGVKFGGVYEIQIFDSFGKPEVGGDDCGGIYPRAELLPRYHHIDKGYAPRVNASRPPGEWQTLEVEFRSPKFDAAGKKVSRACFRKVVLNGQVVHQDVELDSPTGHAWTTKESESGPLLLQADHGPVAFRNIRVRSIPPAGR